LVDIGDMVKVNFIPLSGIKYTSLTVDVTGSNNPQPEYLAPFPQVQTMWCIKSTWWVKYSRKRSPCPIYFRNIGQSLTRSYFG
jgi:hypothetical protein